MFIVTHKSGNGLKHLIIDWFQSNGTFNTFHVFVLQWVVVMMQENVAHKLDNILPYNRSGMHKWMAW